MLLVEPEYKLILEATGLNCLEVVFFWSERTMFAEGPFLKEERLLIDAVAARIGRSVERTRAQAQLGLEQQAIKNANIALKEVLARVQEEKIDVAESVQTNVHKIIFPLIFGLESKIPPQHKNYLKLIKDNLSEITDPLTSKEHVPEVVEVKKRLD